MQLAFSDFADVPDAFRTILMKDFEFGKSFLVFGLTSKWPSGLPCLGNFVASLIIFFLLPGAVPKNALKPMIRKHCQSSPAGKTPASFDCAIFDWPLACCA